jgi:hypothetical protein
LANTFWLDGLSACHSRAKTPQVTQQRTARHPSLGVVRKWPREALLVCIGHGVVTVEWGKWRIVRATPSAIARDSRNGGVLAGIDETKRG